MQNLRLEGYEDRARMIISGKGTISGAYVPYKEYGMELGVMIFEEGITGISGFRCVTLLMFKVVRRIFCSLEF